jgi:hypothetical protein
MSKRITSYVTLLTNLEFVSSVFLSLSRYFRKRGKNFVMSILLKAERAKFAIVGKK